MHAFLHLRSLVESGKTMIFDLMPEMFTLSELQKAYEAVLGKHFCLQISRRKIADWVIETESILEGAGHRPAKLFREIRTDFTGS